MDAGLKGPPDFSGSVPAPGMADIKVRASCSGVYAGML